MIYQINQNQLSLEEVVAAKEKELDTLRTSLAAAKSMGYDLRIVTKGESVTVPAHKSKSTQDEKRGKYLRSANFTRADYAAIRVEILKLAGTQPVVNTHDVYKHLRKATIYTAAKKTQIYWQLATLHKENKLQKIEEGKYSLPKE